MDDLELIPMFPLTLLPLPGELVPLHIFEPRYRQLLMDAESRGITFGIFCSHELNVNKLGSLMKLESVLKRYPTGESDIAVRCVNVFYLDKLYRTFEDKLYPGGHVRFQPEEDLNQMPGVDLYENFVLYQSKRNVLKDFSTSNVHQIAQELHLDLFDRYKFLSFSPAKKEQFLLSQIRYQNHVIKQEEKSRDVFHLN